MKKIVTIALLMMFTIMVNAQERKFSPEKFNADMEAFITKEANLTPQEAAKLFPLMREMRDKQRPLYDKMHRIGPNKPADDAACKQAISEYDKLNVELRQLESTYHKKMMQQIPASKVFDVLRAEHRFHRQAMKGWRKGRPQ